MAMRIGGSSEATPFTHSGGKLASWFKYTISEYTRVDVSSPTHEGRHPTPRAGKKVAISHPNLCTPMQVQAAVLRIVGDLMETIGLTADTHVASYEGYGRMVSR